MKKDNPQSNGSSPIIPVVSDGPERLWKEKSTQEQISKIEAEVRSKYTEEIANSGILKRLLLKFKIRREINKEIDKLVPKKGLYIQS